MSPPAIRLRPADAERYVRLRRRMLDDAPWAFFASPEDDAGLDPDVVAERLAGEHNVLVAVEDPGGVEDSHGTGGLPELVAAAGVVREVKAKLAHRAVVWGVYVEPKHRGEGLGRVVMAAAIEVARGLGRGGLPGLERQRRGTGGPAALRTAGLRSLGAQGGGDGQQRPAARRDLQGAAAAAGMIPGRAHSRIAWSIQPAVSSATSSQPGS